MGRPRSAGRAAAIILAGGSGSRVGATLNKVYLPLAGRRVATWSLTWAGATAEIGRVILVVREEDQELAAETVRREARGLGVELVVGGASRHESEEAGIEHLAPAIEAGEVDVVAVHDAARPLAGPSLWTRCITTARAVGGAVPGFPAPDVLAAGGSGTLIAMPRRESVTRVQTPQAFRAPDLLDAFRKARIEGFHGTDTAACAEAFSSLCVQLVPGSRTNMKVTYPHDLFLAERLLADSGYRLE